LASLDRIVAAKRPAAETLREIILDLVESTAASAQQALVFHREMNRLDDEGSAEARKQRRRYHDAVVRLVRRGQAAGEFADVWSAETAGTDAFTPLALAAAWEPTLRLGTAIVPVYTRGPALIAMSAASLAFAAPGRFVLGLGASSPVIVGNWNGIPFEQPFR